MNLQIELTSHCPFECEYCIRRFWKAKPFGISLEKVKEVVDVLDLGRIFLLYGYRESTIHKNVKDIVRVAKKRAEVVMVTRN